MPPGSLKMSMPLANSKPRPSSTEGRRPHCYPDTPYGVTGAGVGSLEPQWTALSVRSAKRLAVASNV
jgi:hypothetical protein